MLLNNQWITEEIKEEIKKITRDKWKWKHDDTKAMGWSKSSSKRTVIRINLMSGNFLKNQIKKFNLVLNEKKNKGQS